MWMTLLWQNKALIGAGLIAILAGLYIGSLKLQIHNRESTIEQLTATNVTLTAESEARKQTIARLEGSLQTLIVEGKRKQANAAMWKQKFDASEKEVQERLGGLVSWLPTLKETDCESTKRLLKEYRNGR